MRHPRSSLLLLAVLAGPALGQDQADRARLDDFAVPHAESSLRVEQLPATTGSLPQQRPDRALARPTRSDPAGAVSSQLSSTEDADPVTQLANPAESRRALGGSGSSVKDRAPGGVVRLGGQDRCDPQLIQRFYAECLRVLELRSEEFAGPPPPSLSAEQQLLVAQRQPDQSLADAATGQRLRSGTNQTDADVQSNQELAAIFLKAPADNNTVLLNQGADTQAASLAEVLKTLGIETVAPPRGN